MPTLQLLHKDQALRRYPLQQGGVAIGRSPDNQIQLDSPAVDERHAQVFTVGHDSVIVDLHTLSGTFVNGKEIKRAPLKNNDVIQIGGYRLRFFIDALAAAESPAEKELTPEAEKKPTPETVAAPEPEPTPAIAEPAPAKPSADDSVTDKEQIVPVDAALLAAISDEPEATSTGEPDVPKTDADVTEPETPTATTVEAGEPQAAAASDSAPDINEAEIPPAITQPFDRQHAMDATTADEDRAGLSAARTLARELELEIPDEDDLPDDELPALAELGDDEERLGAESDEDLDENTWIDAGPQIEPPDHLQSYPPSERPQPVELPPPPEWSAQDDDLRNAPEAPALVLTGDASAGGEKYYAYIDIMHGPNAGVRVWLARTRTVIGNRGDRTLIIEAHTPREFRAMTAHRGATITINGTLLMSTPVTLRTGDNIEFGNEGLRFYQTNTPPERPAAASSDQSVPEDSTQATDSTSPTPVPE